jgi:CSLREA domain-containing protein
VPARHRADGLCPARPATDVTFRVTTTADAHAPNPGDGHCGDAAGRCTLRAAIGEAGAAPAGTDISIYVPAGRYLLTLGTLTLGARSAPVSMTIRGTGAGGMVISAGDAFRVMRVTASATVVLDGLVIADGSAGQNGFGGGVLSRGTLTITGTAVAGNRAGAGGGLDNSGGSLVLTRSRIQANRAVHADDVRQHADRQPHRGRPGRRHQRLRGAMTLSFDTITTSLRRDSRSGVMRVAHEAVAGAAGQPLRVVDG